MSNISQNERELLAELVSLRRRVARLETLEYGRGVITRLALTDGITAPTAISGQALVYVDTADGDLKVRFADGTTKTIVTDT